MFIAAIVIGLGISPYLAHRANNWLWLRAVEKRPEALVYAMERASRAHFEQE